MSQSTVWRWMSAGTLPTVCVGGRSLISVETITHLRQTLAAELTEEFRRQQETRLAELSGRMMTCGEASTMLRQDVWQVLNLFYKGYLPGELVENRPMVSRRAVEARVREAASNVPATAPARLSAR